MGRVDIPADIEWRVTPGLSPYPETLAEMESRAAAIRAGTAPELVWLLEHPPLFTAGTSADPAELFNPLGFPVYAAGRGGRYTYHGPGQRVVYVLLDLERRGRDVRHFVHSLENWMIATLARLGVEAYAVAGPDRALGARRRGRGEGRGDRRQGAPLGQLSRFFAKPGAGTFPLFRHSALRYCRLPGDQPRRDGSGLRDSSVSIWHWQRACAISSPLSREERGRLESPTLSV